MHTHSHTQGETGPLGLPGPNGRRGAIGIKGERGQDGPQGETGSPVSALHSRLTTVAIYLQLRNL